MGAQEVEQFLNYPAVKGRVASSTQNHALSAILFMYNEVLNIELPLINDVTRAKRPDKIPFEQRGTGRHQPIGSDAG